MDTGAEDPNRGIGRRPIVLSSLTPSVRDYGRKKRLGRFNNV
jgi:hypothetical protein